MKVCELCGKEETFADQEDDEVVLGICEECIQNGPFFHMSHE